MTAPAAVPGSGPNSTHGSLVTAQLGGGHSSSGSVARVQASQVGAQPQASVSGENGTLVQLGTPGAPGAVVLLGPPTLRKRVAYKLTHDFTYDPANLLFQATTVGVQPDLLAALDPVAAVTFGGTIGTGPNGGNTAPDSTGTAQIGSVTVAPVIGFDSQALGTGSTLDGGTAVDGAGSNLADPSLATAQAAEATPPPTPRAPSRSAVSPPRRAAPRRRRGAPPRSAARAASPAARTGPAARSAPSRSAAATRATARPERHRSRASPSARLSLTGTPAGGVALGGASGVAGSGNDANGSLGTAQIGGGNGASGSGGTAQSSGITLGQTATATGTPAGGVSTGSPTHVGQGNGNTATSSLGTAQVGGGNTANGSVGTVQVGSGPSSAGPGTGATVKSVNTPTPLRQPGLGPGPTPVVTPTARSTTPARAAIGVEPAAPKTLAKQHTLGTLPFTGLDLLFVVLAAGALTATGLGLRVAARQR